MIIAEINQKIESPMCDIINLQATGKDTYAFHLFAFGERGTFLKTKTIQEIATKMVEGIQKHCKDFDYIICPEPGGNQWGVVCGFLLKKDVNIIRRYASYPTSLKIRRITRYNEEDLYISAAKRGDRIVVVDDVISGGGTLRSILDGLRSLGCSTSMVQVIAVKGETYQDLQKEYEIPISYLYAY